MSINFNYKYKLTAKKVACVCLSIHPYAISLKNKLTQIKYLNMSYGVNNEIIIKNFKWNISVYK